MGSNKRQVTSIDAEQDVATLVNVFTVLPDRQQELVDVLDVATEQVIRHLPGFVSANIHASLDGTRVVNYAQWASPADFEAMLQDPTAGEHMHRASEIAESFDPNLYRVASVHRVTASTDQHLRPTTIPAGTEEGFTSDRLG